MGWSWKAGVCFLEEMIQVEISSSSCSERLWELQGRDVSAGSGTALWF